MTLRADVAALLLVAGVLSLVGCTGSDSDTTTTSTTSTSVATTGAVTSAPVSSTTTTPAPLTILPGATYEHEIAVGERGITYREGGDDLESVGPRYIAATAGTVYFADPVANTLWILDAESTRIVDLAALDILNVTAIAADANRVFAVEVVFAPARQRLHELTPEGDLVSSDDLAIGARLEDGLSDLLIDDSGEATIVLAGGVLFADPTSGETRGSIAIGGHKLTQLGSDIEVDGTLVTADLSGGFGGLRVLGVGGGQVVLVREEVLSTSPVEVLVSVEWYGADGFAGSARVPLDGQAIPGPPGLTVTEDGRVVMMVSGADAVRITELTPNPERITASSPDS